MRRTIATIGTCGFLAAGLTLMGATATAQAGTVYTFNNITHNNSISEAIGESQLRMDVSDAGSNQVAFKFYQVGTDPAVISEIYFDDDTNVFDHIALIADSGSSVSFSGGANPGHLPGASPSDFTDFPASANNPAPTNGVSPGGEFVTLTLALSSGNDFNDVIDALTGVDLRVGMHVTSFTTANGASESFINDPTSVVPTPSAALAGLGMLSLMGLRRNKRRRTA